MASALLFREGDGFSAGGACTTAGDLGGRCSVRWADGGSVADQGAGLGRRRQKSQRLVPGLFQTDAYARLPAHPTAGDHLGYRCAGACQFERRADSWVTGSAYFDPFEGWGGPGCPPGL